MELFEGLPVWLLAGLIFSFRAIDVSLGTVRTLMTVQGRITAAFALGFVEICIWTTAIAQVITNVADHPLLVVAYAGGFASGNALGIVVERKLAIGTVAIRFISSRGMEIARAIGPLGHVVTAIEGGGPDGPHLLLYVTCARRALPEMIEKAKAIDPDVFFAVDRFAQVSVLQPLPQPTGWRAVFKKK